MSPSDAPYRPPSLGQSGLGWVSMPVLGILIVNAANAVRSWAQLNVSRPSFNSLEPWLPVLHFGSSAGMETLWLGLMAIFSTFGTLALVLALLSTTIIWCVPALPRWRRFLLLWVAVVIAGVVTVGAAQLGEVLLTIELSGGRGGSWVRMFTVPALLEALRWAALWGWIPALATALIATPQPARRRSDGSRRRRGIVVVGALTVAAVLSGLWLVDSSRELMRRSMDASAAPAPTPTPQVTPSDPPALTAAEPVPDVAGRCPGSALSTTFAYTDAASGRRYGVATTTNTSTEACVVIGMPDLAFASADGNGVYPEVAVWTGFAHDILSEEPITLDPGKSAISEATWRGSGAGAVTVAQVYVAPWAGARRSIMNEPLDFETGSLLEVTPWTAAPPAGSVD